MGRKIAGYKISVVLKWR